jgi:hypothetical protein
MQATQEDKKKALLFALPANDRPAVNRIFLLISGASGNNHILMEVNSWQEL